MNKSLAVKVHPVQGNGRGNVYLVTDNGGDVIKIVDNNQRNKAKKAIRDNQYGILSVRGKSEVEITVKWLDQYSRMPRSKYETTIGGFLSSMVGGRNGDEIDQLTLNFTRKFEVVTASLLDSTISNLMAGAGVTWASHNHCEWNEIEAVTDRAADATSRGVVEKATGKKSRGNGSYASSGYTPYTATHGPNGNINYNDIDDDLSDEPWDDASEAVEPEVEAVPAIEVDVDNLELHSGTMVERLANYAYLKPDNLIISDLKWKFLVRSVLRSKNILVTGPSGTGKTK